MDQEQQNTSPRPFVPKDTDIFNDANSYYKKATLRESDICPPISIDFINKFREEKIQTKTTVSAVVVKNYKQELIMKHNWKQRFADFKLLVEFQEKQSGFYPIKNTETQKVDKYRQLFMEIYEKFRQQSKQLKKEMQKQIRVNLSDYISPAVTGMALTLCYEVQVYITESLLDEVPKPIAQYLELIKPASFSDQEFSMLFDGSEKNQKIMINYVEKYTSRKFFELNPKFIWIKQMRNSDGDEKDNYFEAPEAVPVKDYSKRSEVEAAIAHLRKLFSHPELNEGLDLIYGMRGASSKDILVQEEICYQYIQFHIIMACNFLKNGQSMVLRIKGIFNKQTNKYIFLLAYLFDQVHVCKPQFSDIYSNDIYLICTQFQKAYAAKVKDVLLEKYEDILFNKISLFDIKDLYQEKAYNNKIYNFYQGYLDDLISAYSFRLQQLQTNIKRVDQLKEERIKYINEALKQLDSAFHLSIYGVPHSQNKKQQSGVQK